MLLISGLAKFLSLSLNHSSCASLVNRNIYFFVSFRHRNRLSNSLAHHFADVLNMNVYRKNRTYKIYFALFFCSYRIKIFRLWKFQSCTSKKWGFISPSSSHPASWHFLIIPQECYIVIKYRYGVLECENSQRDESVSLMASFIEIWLMSNFVSSSS